MRTRIDTRIHDVIQGCLIGAAIGDAMGVPFEFLRRAEVREVYRQELAKKDTKTPF